MVVVSSNSLSQLDNEETCRELRSKLHTEIVALKETLVLVDKDTTKSVNFIDKNTRNVLDVLQRIIDKTLNNRQQVYHPTTTDSQFPNPIHDVLSVGSLNRIEIPLDVIKMMITAGFDMNSMDNSEDYGATCLLRAIEHRQYHVVRLLVSHQAKCQKCTSVGQQFNSVEKTPIVLLASQQNVPLDLFDMLATPHNLTEALCTAAREGNVETALYLIKLGASVDKTDKLSKQAIDYFVECYVFHYHKCKKFNAELCMHLLPKRAQGLNFFKNICEILRLQCPQNHPALLEILYSFIQRLDFPQPMSVCFCLTFHQPRIFLQLYINHERTASYKIYRAQRTPLGLYLSNLILIEMQPDVISVPDDIVPLVSEAPLVSRVPHDHEELIKYAHAIDDLWRTYRKECKVKSLLRLCILKTRMSMHSLDDYSFRSLPVPPYIRRLLAYRDVSERIYEELCKRTDKSDCLNCNSCSEFVDPFTS